MDILFVHHNYPAQFHKLSELLAQDPRNKVYFLSLFRRRKDLEAKGVHWLQMNCRSKDLSKISINEMATLFAEGQMLLKKKGLQAELIHGHANFGCISYSKEVFPQARQTGFFEWMYTPATEKEIHHTDLKPDFSMQMQQRQCNIISLGALDMVDVAITATQWQRAQFPIQYIPKLQTVHNGIDTEFFCLPSEETLAFLPPSLEGLRGKPVVTFLARSLEPHRGFPSFYRSIPHILEQRPDVHIVIVGGEKLSYSLPLPNGKSYLQQMQEEVQVDTSRVHIFPMQTYPVYRAILHMSSVHVYLSVPFTTSWSLLESMSCGCTMVASATAPVQEIIQDGHNGLLVDFHDPKEIAEKVCYALKNHDALETMRQYARSTVVHNFDEKMMLKKYVQCLTQGM